MSSNTNTTADTTNCKYTISDTSDSDARCSYSTRKDGRAILRDPDGKMLNIARLTAYAEHGEEVHRKSIHHEIPTRKIDIPEFLRPMSRAEHSGFHASDPDPVFVDEIPLLRPEEDETGVER